jgi:hypothetical protein
MDYFKGKTTEYTEDKEIYFYKLSEFALFAVREKFKKKKPPGALSRF